MHACNLMRSTASLGWSGQDWTDSGILDGWISGRMHRCTEHVCMYGCVHAWMIQKIRSTLFLQLKPAIHGKCKCVLKQLYTNRLRFGLWNLCVAVAICACGVSAATLCINTALTVKSLSTLGDPNVGTVRSLSCS